MELAEHNAHSRKVRNDHNGLWPDVEDLAHQSFLDRRQRALPVSKSDLRQDAVAAFENWWGELPAERQDEMRQQRPERVNFVASDGWLSRFLARKCITFRRKTKDTATLPRDAEERVTRFQNEVRGTVRENNVHTIFNFNETFTQLDFPPMYTAATKGSKNIDVQTSRGNPKLGCTVGIYNWVKWRETSRSCCFQGAWFCEGNPSPA